MSRVYLVFMCMLGLAACGSNPADDSAEVTNNGRQAYLAYCAGCHETGVLGAPIVGEPANWEVRSTLWQAVLMKHAKEGYYDMPAKGGRIDLSDATIDAAAEYMLVTTFPDLPMDR